MYAFLAVGEYTVHIEGYNPVLSIIKHLGITGGGIYAKSTGY